MRANDSGIKDMPLAVIALLQFELTILQEPSKNFIWPIIRKGVKDRRNHSNQDPIVSRSSPKPLKVYSGYVLIICMRNLLILYLLVNTRFCWRENNI
jgi:hypothetical protein